MYDREDGEGGTRGKGAKGRVPALGSRHGSIKVLLIGLGVVLLVCLLAAGFCG